MEPIILLLILIFGIAVIVLQIAAIRRLSAQNAKNEELTRMLQQENDKLKNFLLQQNSDLRRELMEQDSIDTYIKANQTLFTDKSVAELLTELYEQKDLTKAELARRASMSEVYLHQVFSGRRNPSRDRLICLCIGLETSLDEAQAMLKGAGFAAL